VKLLRSDAHFVLNLRAGDGGSELVARDVYYKVKNPEGFAPTSAKLFTGSVEATDSSGDLIKDLQNSFPYYIDTPGGGMSSHATEQLRLVAMQLQRADPTASLEVTAYGSNKSTVRASVIAKLQTFGIANASKRTSKKVFGSKNPNTNSKDYVKIGLASGMGMVDTSSLPLFSYPAAAAQSESSSPSIATLAADGVRVLPESCRPLRDSVIRVVGMFLNETSPFIWPTSSP
jgi:hypothetical protein